MLKVEALLQLLCSSLIKQGQSIIMEIAIMKNIFQQLNLYTDWGIIIISVHNFRERHEDRSLYYSINFFQGSPVMVCNMLNAMHAFANP